jgi:hypothetical protein
MKKFTFDKNTLLSAGIVILTGALTLLKSKDAEVKKQIEKEEWIQEAMERLSKKKEN